MRHSTSNVKQEQEIGWKISDIFLEDEEYRYLRS